MDADGSARPTRARAVAVEQAETTALSTGWTVASVGAGAAAHPAELAALIGADAWIPAAVPGTAASALRTAGKWDLESTLDFDADDWWFRCAFDVTAPKDGRRRVLRFDGLATLAHVWLNGHLILSSESMWQVHEIEASALLRAHNELVIRCCSLRQALSARRPRPKWRTRVVEQQQLRWFRTTLIGRMPGWCPSAAAVGPWRDVSLETQGPVVLEGVDLRPSLSGNDGRLDVNIRVALAAGLEIARATLRCGSYSRELTLASAADGVLLTGTLALGGVAQWWPHTHGEPVLHDVSLAIEANGVVHDAMLGRVGFRDIVVDRGTDGRGFALRVNDIPVFARGACWAPLDAASLDGTSGSYRDELLRVTAAGFNMIRIGGTMTYESDAFYSLCDELGILVWQDFMFANMDYPAEDARFAALVEREVTQFLDRHAHRPSLAVLCGGSEVEQQAAMLGLASDAWRGALHSERFPAWCAARAPGVPYVSNSPSGGALPFLANEGIAHYYGVGAYLRPLEDARRAAVRFTTECLGFANVPEPRTVELVVSPTESAPHHPRWKSRVPRDRGAGWDFDDVRDHYFKVLFGADPLTVRYSDADRYLALSRVTTGAVMARTIAEWRRPGSGCHGAIIWMHRDLWPGAGWGVVDSTGTPKAAYWFLARACAPVAILSTDEGVNGVGLHIINDAPGALDADVVVTLWRDRLRVGEGSAPVTLAPHAASTLGADEILGRFTDVGYAYRFGPPGHDLMTAALRDRATGSILSEEFHFPLGIPAMTRVDINTQAEAWPESDGTWMLAVRSDALSFAVALDVPGFEYSDSYFHVAPGATKRVTLRSNGSAPRPSGTVHALNASEPTRIVVLDAPPTSRREPSATA